MPSARLQPVCRVSIISRIKSKTVEMYMTAKSDAYINRRRRSRSAAAYIVVKLSRGRSVGLSIGLSHSVQCIVAKRRTGPEMRQVVGFGDRSTGRGTFGGEFGARHCNQWGLYGVCMRQRRDAALFPNYFGQTC